ncbi:YdhR family protein [Aquimarina algicola]|uniref:YdhR family protein n=1 Tax=Aquimarina algicola TaxID=2589995 RepID=UPI001CF182F6|nr:YdhR family protein [Aquimarina algicola]
MKEKTLINIKFKSSLNAKEFNYVKKQRHKEIASIQGLVSLFCHYNEETEYIGGLFIFNDLQSAQNYLSDFLMIGLGLRYGIIANTLNIEISSLKEEIKGLNHGSRI